METLVPERCSIFCWQVMKMSHLFLTSRSLKGVLYYSSCFTGYRSTAQRVIATVKHTIFRIIENYYTFSGNSCARKMFHLLLAGYEDVTSFLNQSKLKRSLILFILLHRLLPSMRGFKFSYYLACEDSN